MFAVSVFFFRMPPGVSLMLAAITGGIVSGNGLPVRHLVEGGFGFFEAIMIICTAMIFMRIMEATGSLSDISRVLLRLFYRRPTMLMIAIMIFIMFPGMLTGLASTCILTTGALAAPILIRLGMPRLAVGGFIAMASVFGEVAPPISIPVMIIGGGVDMPYIGFGLPLLVASFPAAIGVALYFRYRYLPVFDSNMVVDYLEASEPVKSGFRLYFPILFVIIYMIAEISLHRYVPHLGVPLIFIIGAIMGLFAGNKVNIMEVSRGALRSAMPVLSILVGVGMFLQIMALTGVRGWLAVTALNLPEGFRYMAAAIMPFMGSAYASASVIGVPLVYVFIGKSVLMVTAALVLMAALGDMMPPPSLLCAYAGQIVDEKNHFRILKLCLIPIAFSMATAILILIFAQQLANLLL